MKILALDLATTTGWAFGEKKFERCIHGVMNFTPLPQEGEGARYLKFHAWFRKMLDEHQPTHVFYEGVINAHQNSRSGDIYGGLLGQVLMLCEHRKIKYESLHVGSIKKFATGKGNAKKPEMIIAAKEMGYMPQDDNAADAIHIWHYSKHLLTTKGKN